MRIAKVQRKNAFKDILFFSKFEMVKRDTIIHARADIKTSVLVPLEFAFSNVYILEIGPAK